MVLAKAKGSVVSLSFLISVFFIFFMVFCFGWSGWGQARHPLKGGLWLVIAAFELGTDALLTDQLHRRQKEVFEGSQFVSVNILHRLAGRKRVIAQVAEDFAYMGPVFLFDMGVVVFFVGACSGK